MCDHNVDKNNEDRIKSLSAYLSGVEKKWKHYKQLLKLYFLKDMIRRTEAKEENVTLGCACYPNILTNEESLKNFCFTIIMGGEEDDYCWYRLKEIVMDLSEEEQSSLNRMMKERKKELKRKIPIEDRDDNEKKPCYYSPSLPATESPTHD
jgi:hypothetical protein